MTRLAALLASMLVGLTACASTQSTPDGEVTVTAAPADTGRLALEGATPTLWPRAWLSEVGEVKTESVASPTWQVHASWPTVAGNPALGRAMGESAQRKATDFMESYQPPGPNQVATPELNSTWLLTAIDDSMAGILSDEFLNGGGSASTSWSSTWYDIEAKRVVPNSELVNSVDALLRDLTADAKEQAKNPMLVDKITDVPPVLAFTSQGHLLAGFDEGVVMPASAGRLTVELSAEQTAALLSPLGRRAQAAAITPESDGRPDSTSTPSSASSTSSPEATPAAEATPSPSAPLAKPSAPVALPPAGSKPNCAKLKCVAITYDDGPGPLTPALLATLKAKKAPATFYLLGQQVQTYPGTARAIVAAGHQLGNHTWDHRSLPALSATGVAQEIDRTSSIIAQVTGQRPTTFRPPYGATNATVKAAAKKAGMTQQLWDVDTLDWQTRSTTSTVQTAVNKARRNSVILMHDIQPSTIPAAAKIIDGLRAKGFTLVRVQDLR